MPRPKKPVNYEEEFARIDAQITKWKNTIKELEEERQALLRQKEQEEISLLYGIVKESGMSLTEVMARIQSE